MLADATNPATIKATTMIKVVIMDSPPVQVALYPPSFAGTSIFFMSAGTSGGGSTASTTTGS
jgi:hypothetical protein